MSDFFAVSGWFFGLISTTIAIFQFIEKEKYRNQIVKMQQVNKDDSTGYQAGRDMTVNN